MTVKAYPQIGRRTGESVCVAGIRTDIHPPQWARLFPIPFRDLDRDVQFRKYQYITLKAHPSRRDRRPESLRPDCDTIRLGPELSSSGPDLDRRRALVDAVMIESMCELQRMQEVQGTSLGAFRPADVADVVSRRGDEWDAAKKTVAAQRSLFAPDKEPLEQPPWQFSYRYRCLDASCGGHEQTIVDWEIGQAWRAWRELRPEPDRVEAIRNRWLDELCSGDRDTVFFAGNMHQHPKSFLILGVFWPRRTPYTRPLFG